MTFPTIVFGNAVLTAPGTATFTHGSSISGGGFRLFVKPTIDMGLAPIDIGFTYVNQFGVTKISTVTTAISAGTTAGTHKDVTLESGDTGIRDIIGISYLTGGTIGDTLSFESWNEGLGAPPEQITSAIPELYYSLPTIPVPITISNTTDIIEYLPELEIDRGLPVRELTDNVSNLALFLPEPFIDRGLPVREDTFNRADKVLFIPEPYGFRADFTGYDWPLLKSWLESVVGQVLAGYVTNTNNELIINAIRLVIVSTAEEVINPTNAGIVAAVNPVTGVYQAFLKKLTYDKRYLIVQIGIDKTTSLIGGGTPAIIDANQTLPTPYNIQFACPTIECDFDMTRKQ